MLRAALLDMYNGESNRGIPMLRSILSRYANVMTYDHFDVRAKNQIPDLSYDVYVFSGGPGDPLLAHTADERVERASLESVRATLASLLSTAPVPEGAG